MNDRPVIQFSNPSGLMLAFGLSSVFWTMLVCAILFVNSVSPRDYVPWRVRHMGHEVRAHIAQIYSPEHS